MVRRENVGSKLHFLVLVLVVVVVLLLLVLHDLVIGRGRCDFKKSATCSQQRHHFRLDQIPRQATVSYHIMHSAGVAQGLDGLEHAFVWNAVLVELKMVS